MTGVFPCKAFSQSQSLNFYEMDTKRVEDILSKGRAHLHNAITTYVRTGFARDGLVLHEQPGGDTTWQDPRVITPKEKECMIVVQNSMCRWDTKLKDLLDEGSIKKTIQWLTNSERIVIKMRGTCSNDEYDVLWRSHIALASEYRQPKLCEAVIRGIKEDMETKGEISNLEEGIVALHEPNVETKNRDVYNELESY